MIVFPNAKINLGLRILKKRTDGYHDIHSYMVPVNFCDALEIVPSHDGFSFSTSGINIEPGVRENLCVQAYELMKQTYDISEVKIHLHKLIPPGSGLGGGSSDAAFTLSLLRKLHNINVCNSEIEGLASLLGSDCPFFVTNKPQLVQFTGTPSHKFLRLKNYYVVIVIPPVHISTPWAYSIITPSGVELPDPDTILTDEDKWPELLVNDFEEPVFKYYPELREIKNKLYKSGAFFASMSGSGSAIYGLFRTTPQVENLFEGYTLWKGEVI